MALMLFACALLLSGLGLPLALGRVRRNRLFGLRTPTTLSDERIWLAANRAYGRAEVVGGLALLVAALIAKTVALPDHPLTLLLMFAAAKVPALVLGSRAAKRAQSELVAGG